MKAINIALSTTLIFLSWNSTASSDIKYGTLKNHITGKNLCLSSVKNKNELTFLTCNNSNEQEWKFTPSSSGYFFIKNKIQEDKCLRTTSSTNGKTAQLGSCYGDGYTSMRQWAISYSSGGSIILKNKFNNDLGHNETLNVDENTKTIKMSKENNAQKTKWNYNNDIPSPKRSLTGNKKVLLMATHFNGVLPAEPEPIRKAVFGDNDDYSSLQHYLKLASNEKLTIEGTFLRNINIGERPASCNSAAILKNARKAAREKGVEPNDYDFLFIDISRYSACKWEGLAATPGNWILSNGVGYKYWMWSHEFGHNVGLLHSTTLRKCPTDNGIVQINNNCVPGGGEDTTDTMGGGGGKLYPVDYQLFAGWLEDKDTPLIKDSGTYKLTPLWQPGGPQGYRIQRDDGSVLILEFRQPQEGFESWEKNSPFVKGVSVRIAKYSGSNLTNTLIDATPDSTSGMKDAPLMPGKSLYDTLSGKLITVLSADSNGAVIKVDNKL